VRTSESIKEIAAALPKAQSAIKSASKDVTNTFFKSKYADLASVIDACRDALNAQGISMLQSVRATESGVAVETTLLHSSGEWISSELEMPVTKADAQGVGSAITYAKRYSLQALVGVPSEDDDGNKATDAAPKKGAAAQGFEESVKSVAAVEFEKLSVEEQVSMRLHASIIKEMNPVKGAAYIAEQKFSLDDEAALWSLLPSYKRSAIKNAQQTASGALATQA
jgi:hypothetical protein